MVQLLNLAGSTVTVCVSYRLWAVTAQWLSSAYRSTPFHASGAGSPVGILQQYLVDETMMVLLCDENCLLINGQSLRDNESTDEHTHTQLS